MDELKICFVSLDKNLPIYMDKYFANKNVSYKVQNILECDSADIIVSPGNSFGQMDGGIDLMISKILSNKIGKIVRKKISEKYFGEQPIGTCIIVKTGNQKYPFLAHAPTMIIPKNVEGTLNAYYAFKAVLTSVINYNKRNSKKIHSILTTTFCTGCGDMELEKSLKQMRYAIEVVENGVGKDWDSANEHYLGLLDLQ